MHSFRLLASSIVAVAAIALVAGCSTVGPQLGPTASNAVPPSVLAPGTTAISRPSTGGTYLHVDAKKAKLIYVTSGVSSGTVTIYPLFGKNQKQVGQITGLTNAGGLAIGHNTDLYVANEGVSTILEYSLGTKPKLVATLDDSGQYPVDVAVDPKTRDIAATNFETTSGGSGSVSFYHTGSTKPYKTVTALDYTYFAGFNDKGDLFVDGRTSSSPFTVQVGKIAAGGTTLTLLPISDIAFPGGVKVDKADNLLIDDQIATTINCYASTSPYAPCGTTHLLGAHDPINFALLKNNNRLYTADPYTPGVAQEYAFPGGGQPVNTISVGGAPGGIAISPPSQP